MRVRLRLQVPVPSWEKERVSRTLRQKISRECASWANAYTGQAVLAVEESSFGQELERELEGVIATEPAFVGAVAVYPAITPDELGIPHGLENITVTFRPETAGIDVGLETFADNVTSWSKGYALATLIPSCIREEWDVVRYQARNQVFLTRSMSLIRLHTRVPYTDSATPATGPATVQRIVDATLAMTAWDEEAR